MNNKTMTLRLATFNICSVCDQYDKRKGMMLDTIYAQEADIFGIQEVDFEQQIDFLVDSSKYQAEIARLQRPWRNMPEHPEMCIDGIMVMASSTRPELKILSNQVVHLSTTCNAQIVEFPNNLYVVHAHLHDVVTESEVRLGQMRDLLAYLRRHVRRYEDATIILMGDMNAQPQEECIKLLVGRENFRSAYHEFHGEHPKMTFPSGLQGPYMDVDGEGCYDYIFVKTSSSCEGGMIVHEASIFGDQPHPEDDTVYPSDHMGIFACVEVPVFTGDRSNAQ